MNNISQWLLQHYGKENYHPGLDRIKAALAPLFPKFKQTKIVIVAGTNGKGETTIRLSRLLDAKKRCVWTSPHVERVTERFTSEEGEIQEGELQRLVLECHEKVLKHKFQLTYYEFLFFVFCTWAEARGPEVLLLEVGLGGRWDAVNVFDAHYVLLPSISRDHQEYLGGRYESILSEKLGVLRPRAVLISFLELKYLRERAYDHAKNISAEVVDMEDVKPVTVSHFSERNQLLAYAAYRALLGMDIRELRKPETYKTWSPELIGLEHRGEVVQSNGEWVFFGSHNIDGLRKLIQFLRSGTYNLDGRPFDSVIVAFSRRDPGDLRAMLKMIKTAGLGKVQVTVFDHPKAASRDLIEGLTRQEGLEFVANITSHVQGKNINRTLVTGSYYFLGHIKCLLRR